MMDPSALRVRKVRREILVDLRDRKARPATMGCRGLKETMELKARRGTRACKDLKARPVK